MNGGGVKEGMSKELKSSREVVTNMLTSSYIIHVTMYLYGTISITGSGAGRVNMLLNVR